MSHGTTYIFRSFIPLVAQKTVANAFLCFIDILSSKVKKAVGKPNALERFEKFTNGRVDWPPSHITLIFEICHEAE